MRCAHCSFAAPVPIHTSSLSKTRQGLLLTIKYLDSSNGPPLDSDMVAISSMVAPYEFHRVAS